MPVIADSSSSFLVQPAVGLMIWTLFLFGVSMWILAKFVFPLISDALGKRQQAIEDEMDAAERRAAEAERLLTDYRERLKEARVQADEIVTRARKTAEEQESEALEEARRRREEMLEQTRRDVQAETRRAISEIRAEVTNLTVLATEKVTRKVLDDADQRRLVDDALAELDFSALGAGSEGP